METKQNNIKYTLEGFMEFIEEIKNTSSDYDYVVVRGRRCFNIMARFLPKVDFITFPALLSNYKKLADYYQQNKRFPKILLIDDLVFSGRGMASDLERLEGLLTEELLDRKVFSKEDNYRYSVYRKLADAVTTYVYAKNAGKFFFGRGYEFGYLELLYFQNELYFKELRDYSLQLGEKIKQWDIANTDSTYSVRSRGLSDIILQHPNGRIGETNWVRQEGNCLGEPMILYTRLNGKKTINRIDTIRFFPNRISHFKELPFISSFSFFGMLSQNVSIQLIREVRQELENSGLNNLAEILKESANQKISSILLENQMNLISCILSIAICFDFFSDVLSKEQLKQTMIDGDLWKISRNFGKGTDLIEEFLAIRKKDLRNRLCTIILNIIDSNASELIPFNLNNILDNINMESINLEKITDTMRNVLFRVEAQSRKSAYKLKIHEFEAKNYQTSILPNETYGHDGIISFESLFHLEEIRQLITSSIDVYSLIFAFIGLIDNYQASLRLKSLLTQKNNIMVQNCIITHEQAGFYLPEKLVTLIEPLEEIENNSFGSAEARLKNVHNFIMMVFFGIKPHLANKWPSLEITDDIKQLLIEILTSFYNEKSFDSTLEKLFADMDRFYLAGMSCYGFNFDNLRVIAKQHGYLTADTSKLEACLKHAANIFAENYWHVYNIESLLDSDNGKCKTIGTLPNVVSSD